MNESSATSTSLPSPTDSVQANLDKLRAQLRDLRSTIVCFSGGIDSALVLQVAHEELGANAVGLTAVSPSLPHSEREGAERTAREIGARHEFVSSFELDRPGYVENSPSRCFHCKTELYAIAEAKRIEWGIATIVNGTNTDDLGDYRPGLQAAAQANVRSPLAELGLTKADVRAIAQRLGLRIWNKPASACLSSRIPYGTRVTEERLLQIGNLEAELRALGFSQLRVRWHDQIARLEVPLDDLPRLCQPEVRERVLAAGKRHGFLYVTADLAGYRTGSHNEALPSRSLPVIG